jgi:PEP-CTERM motif
MRRYLLSLVVFLVVASAATGVHASTDCQRWFIEYKNSLAQTSAAKHLLAAKHRAHRYVHRKLAALHKPKPANKPRVLPARFQRPKMTREEALRRFNLACGDMPEDMPSTQMVQEEEPKPDYLANPLHSEMPLEKPVGGGIVAENVVPPNLPFLPGGGWGSGGSYPPGISGGFGGGGGAPGAPTPHNPGNPPPDAPPPPPPVSTVPEPGSIVLLLTGVAGAAGVARRRFVR